MVGPGLTRREAGRGPGNEGWEASDQEKDLVKVTQLTLASSLSEGEAAKG